MSALVAAPQQPRSDEVRQMTAARLGCDVAFEGEIGGRERAPTHQGLDHARPGGRREC